MTISVYFAIACWIVFAVFWRLTAYSAKETVKRQPYGEMVVQTACVFTAFFLLWSSFNVTKDVPVLARQIVPASALSYDAGDALCALGLGLTLWARVILGRNWSATVTLKRDHELIQSGPYRFVRHPIYTGMLTMFLGSAIVVGTVAAMAGLPIMFMGFWKKSRREEAFMEAHFPDAYPTYKRRVKAMIPFIL